MSQLQSINIQKPSTSGDNGTPTNSCVHDLKRVLRLIEDERHLIANDLYQDIIGRIDTFRSTSLAAAAIPVKRLRLRKSKSITIKEEITKDIQEAEGMISSNRTILDNLSRRCRLFAKARNNLLDDDHWTLAQTLFGITTFYRTEKDGSISIKLEGKLEGVSLFDQVAILREVDLHYKWAPCVSSSQTIAHLDKLDTVGWFVVGLPSFGLMRDVCFRAMGCDSMLEDGSFLLVAQGINDQPESKNANPTTLSPEEVQDLEDSDWFSKDPILDSLDLPEPPNRFGSGRITLRKMQALIQVESPTCARTLLITNLDPNLAFFPQSLLDFVMKKLCGVMLNKLQAAAKRVSKDPVNNAHASMMRKEEAFYKQWLLPKFEAVCKLRNWKVPKVTSLELSDQQMELAEKADAKRRRKSKTNMLRYLHSMGDEKLGDLPDDGSASLSEPENIGRGGPRVRTMTEESVLSDISRNSSSLASTWLSNPLSSYMRELEEKAQLRKARDIQQSRERAANRLKPKPLDEASKARLVELRKARQRRETGSITVTAASRHKGNLIAETPLPEPVKESQRRDIATTLAKHGIFPRFVIMATLTSSLFILLSLGPSIEEWIAAQVTTFNEGFRRDFVAVFYVSVSGWLHFMMSYVSLIYAFSALRIGSVAGREALRFYSQNIHLILGIFSSSLVAFGLLRATAISFLRWSICKGVIFLEFLSGHLSSGRTWIIQSLPETAISTYHVLADLTAAVVQFTLTVFATIFEWVMISLVESNKLGRSISGIFCAIARLAGSGWSRASMFVHNSLEASQGRMELPIWREDVCTTSRILLLYSGTFLLVVLLLFTIFAKLGQSKPSKTGDKSGNRESGSGGDLKESDDIPALQASLISSPDASTLYASRSRTKSMSPKFDTIDEISDDAFHDTFQDVPRKLW